MKRFVCLLLILGLTLSLFSACEDSKNPDNVYSSESSNSISADTEQFNSSDENDEHLSTSIDNSQVIISSSSNSDVNDNFIPYTFPELNLTEREDIFLNILNYDNYIIGDFVSKIYNESTNSFEFTILSDDKLYCFSERITADFSYSPNCITLNGWLDKSTDLSVGQKIKIYYDGYINQTDTTNAIIKAKTNVGPITNSEEFLHTHLNSALENYHSLQTPKVITPDEAMLTVCNYYEFENMKKSQMETTPLINYYSNGETVVVVYSVTHYLKDNAPNGFLAYSYNILKTDNTGDNYSIEETGYVLLETGEIIKDLDGYVE